MPRSPYADLWERLITNTHEPENDQACWIWNGGNTCRYGYGRLNVYCAGRTHTISAHVAAHVWVKNSPATVDEFMTAYRAFRASRLELDHLCVESGCINPDHTEPVTQLENTRRRDARRWGLYQSQMAFSSATLTA